MLEVVFAVISSDHLLVTRMIAFNSVEYVVVSTLGTLFADTVGMWMLSICLSRRFIFSKIGSTDSNIFRHFRRNIVIVLIAIVYSSWSCADGIVPFPVVANPSDRQWCTIANLINQLSSSNLPQTKDALIEIPGTSLEEKLQTLALGTSEFDDISDGVHVPFALMALKKLTDKLDSLQISTIVVDQQIDEQNSDFVRRIYGAIDNSIRNGVYPIADVQGQAAVPKANGSDGYYWEKYGAHTVLILEVNWLVHGRAFEVTYRNPNSPQMVNRGIFSYSDIAFGAFKVDPFMQNENEFIARIGKAPFLILTTFDDPVIDFTRAKAWQRRVIYLNDLSGIFSAEAR